MPSTYEHIVPEYADFGDLSEDVLFPGEFDLSEFGNKSMPNVIWSNSGNYEVGGNPDSVLILYWNYPIYQIMRDHSIISLQPLLSTPATYNIYSIDILFLPYRKPHQPNWERLVSRPLGELRVRNVGRLS